MLIQNTNIVIRDVRMKNSFGNIVYIFRSIYYMSILIIIEKEINSFLQFENQRIRKFFLCTKFKLFHKVIIVNGESFFKMHTTFTDWPLWSKISFYHTDIPYQYFSKRNSLMIHWILLHISCFVRCYFILCYFLK